MTTAAEIAAGQAIYALDRGLYGQEWYELSDEQRAHYVERGAAAVRAYQREAWREPTAEDIRERKPLLVTNSYMRRQDEWSSWRRPTISEWFQRSDEFDAIRVQDLPPLPEPRS